MKVQMWKCKNQVCSGAEARCRQEFGLRAKRGHPWSSLEPPSRPGGQESKQDEGRFFCSRLVFQENKLLLQDNYVPSKIMVFQARSLFFKQNNCVSGKIIMFQADNCVSGKQALCLQGDDTWRVVGRISTNKWPARAMKNLANPFCKRLSHFPEISYNTGGSYKLKKLVFMY